MRNVTSRDAVWTFLTFHEAEMALESLKDSMLIGAL